MDAIISGLVLGGLYALIAQGFVLTFVATRTLNFAAGDLMALAAFLALWLGSTGWSPPALSFALVVVVLGVLGSLVYLFVIRKFSDQGGHDTRWLLTTIGLSIILLNLLQNSQGELPRALGYGRIGGYADILGVRVPAQSLLIAMVALAISLTLWFVSTRTMWGLRMRAVSEDSSTAALMGISPRRIALGAYGLATAITGAAAMLWGAEVGVSVHLGAPLLIGSFAVAVIGGLTSIPGVIVGGIVYGVATQVSSYQLGPIWGEISGLFLVVAVLVVKPEGLLGRRMEVKV